jgi:hypothetical protein
MPARSLQSTNASATATRGITEAVRVRIKNWFERGLLPLFSSVWENKLSYSSASNMMAVKQNTNSANTKNAMKAVSR